MDPNKTLERLRELVAEAREHVRLGVDTELENEFEQLFNALDDWIQAGGFLPTDWQEV